MKLQNRLREARISKQITQEALASLVGVTRQTVIAVEKGKFGPSVELALKLSKVLDCSVEDMFWLDENS